VIGTAANKIKDSIQVNAKSALNYWDSLKESVKVAIKNAGSTQ
jgi:hypothetical protein